MLNTNKQTKRKLFILICLSIFLFLFNYIYLIYDVKNTYWLYGDQTRDWRIASLTQLHLIGTPIATGGYSLGPIFYWMLQITYHFVGPFFNYLPHVAVYGQSFFCAFANVFLFYALSKKYFSSSTILFALMLFYISSPMLASIGSSSWNPNFASSFVNLSLGFAIFKGIFETGFSLNHKKSAIIFISLSWFAAQCHSPGLFYALGAFILVFLKTSTIKRKIQFFFLTILVIIILQIPYLYYMLNHTQEFTTYKGGTSTAFMKFILFQGGYGRGFEFIFKDSSLMVLNFHNIFPLIIVYISLFLILIKNKLYREPLYQFSFLFLFIMFYCYSAIPSYDRSTYILMANIFPFAILPTFLLLHEILKFKKLNLFLQILILSVVVYSIPKRFSQKNSVFPFYKNLTVASQEIYESHKEVKSITIPKFSMPVDSTIIYEGFGGKINLKNNIEVSVDMDGKITYNSF